MARGLLYGSSACGSLARPARMVRPWPGPVNPPKNAVSSNANDGLGQPARSVSLVSLFDQAGPVAQCARLLSRPAIPRFLSSGMDERYEKEDAGRGFLGYNRIRSRRERPTSPSFPCRPF